MERRGRLILTALLLAAVECASPKVGRLVIRSNEENEESVIIKDKCQCQPDKEMTFSISSSLLPDINFDADTKDFDFDFHGQSLGCGGKIEFNAQRELDVTFKIDRSCGVYMNPSGQLPDYIAEEFTGKRMETRINLMYRDSHQKEQHVSAHLTCVCPSQPQDEKCKNGKFIFDENFQCGYENQPICNSFKFSNGIDLEKSCGLKIVESAYSVRIHGEVSLMPRDQNDFSTDSYECEILEDKDEYVKIQFKIENKKQLTIMNSSIITEDSMEFEHSCLKPASWTDFGPWSSCTHTCHPLVSGGCPRIVRRRYCDNGAVGFPGCEGEDLESKACPDLDPCESPCPGKSVLNGNLDGCEVNGKHNTYVLLPHNIWSSLNEIDPTSSKTITFNPNPDSKSSLAILKKDGDKLNFELVTGKPGNTWAVDGQSLNIAEPDFTNLNGQNGFIKVTDKDSDKSFILEEVSPFNPYSVEGQVLEEVFWSGNYDHIVFVNSEVTFGRKKNSFTSNYHILAKNINGDVLPWEMLSVLNDEAVWASSVPVPIGDLASSPTCKSDFDQCSLKDLDQTQCDSIACTSDMMKNGDDPCKLTGTFKGFMSFSEAQACGPCVGCSQVKLTCSVAGQPQWTLPECASTTCKPCTVEEQNNLLPQWSAWTPCSDSCFTGRRSKNRPQLTDQQKLEIAEKASCLVNFDSYESTTSQVCNEVEIKACPSQSLSCGNEKDRCVACDDSVNATCTYLHNGCDIECFEQLSCQKECCDSDVDVGDGDCKHADSCAIGYNEVVSTTKCANKFEVSRDSGDKICQEKNKHSSCFCVPNDRSHFDCVTLSAEEFGKQECRAISLDKDPSNVEFKRVGGHCRVKKEFESTEANCTDYDQFVDCIAPACDHSVLKNCCADPDCPVNGQCKVQQNCKDDQGNSFQDLFDCCETKPECNAKEIEACKPCEKPVVDLNQCASQQILCPDQNCTIHTSQCTVCQEQFCEEIVGDEINIFKLNRDSLDDLRLSLPADLYTDQLRFTIGKPTSFNTPGCFVDYDRSSDIEVDLKFDRKEIANCDVDSLPTDNSNLKANIYVDKKDSQKNSISTHTPFLKIDCSYKPTPVETRLEVIQNRDPLTFSGVIPGEVDITLEMSAKADFSTLLSEDENVVLVGDLLYARIRGDQDFKITSCHVMDANHISGSQHKYQLLDDGCPAEDDLVKLFKFGFVPTPEKFTKIFKWQNFIFRDGAPNQRLVYQCVVEACLSDCEQTCVGGRRRKRRESEMKSRLTQATNFYFFMEVYETRKMLEQALRERRNDYSKELLVTVVSSVLLLGLAAGMAIYLLFPRSKETERRPYADVFHAQLRALLEERVKPALNSAPKRVKSPPPYPNNPTLKADEYARALQGGHLVDDPNFIVNSLSPKIFVRNNNDEN